MRITIKKVSYFFEKCLIICIAASFWLFIMALPPFRIGIWVDSECVLATAHLIFSVLGLCLIILWSLKRKLYCSIHTLIFFSFALISLLATLWANNSTVHHLGSPLLGEGSVLFCGLSLLSFAIDNSSQKNTIYWSAVFAGIIAGILVFLHHPQHGLKVNPNWLPYVFGAFLAPIALGIYAVGTRLKSKTQQKILLLLSCLLLLLSHNKTAWAALILSLCIWPIIKHKQHLQKYICASIPFGMMIGIYVLGTKCVVEKWPIFSSLESRKLALQTYALTWKDNPLKLLSGNGWGYYFENLQKQITKLPVVLFQDNSWKPSWDGVDRFDFHCMHFGAETLFSIGIIGLILYITLLVSPLSEAPTRKSKIHTFMFVTLFGCVTSTWFTLVCVWPFLILGFSIFDRYKIIITRAPLTILWLWISTIFCAYAAATYWNTAILYPANQKSLFFRFTHSKKLPSAGDIRQSYNYKGFHLGHFTLSILKKINQTPSRATMNELNLIFKIYDAKTSPLILDVALLHGLKYFQGSSIEKQLLWDSLASAIQQKAPKRSDLLVQYISELIENNDFTKAKSLISAILSRNPQDPFGFWLEGIFLIHTGATKQGKILMEQALQHNIEKWIYIPKNLKELLHQEEVLL